MASLLGVPQLQLECSGTASLIIALITLKRLSPSRKTVIIPAYTCPLVPIAVKQSGLEPCLCDLAPGHFDMDPSRLHAACNEETLAILPTHLGGRVADVAEALQCARRVGAWVIEDAAQALGGRHDGLSLGLRGDIAFFSLAAGKGLTLFEGGLLLASDPILRAQLNEVSAELNTRKPFLELQRTTQLLGYTVCYHPRLLWYVYGMPLRRAIQQGEYIQAVGDRFPLKAPLHRIGQCRQSVGSHALARFPQWLADTEAQAKRRLHRLRAIRGTRVFEDADNSQGVWPFFMVWMSSEKTRDRVLEQLWDKGLGLTRLFIHALSDYDYLKTVVRAADVPEARLFASHTFTISNSLWLDDARFERICQVIEKEA